MILLLIGRWRMGWSIWLLLLLLCDIEDNRTARTENVEDVYVYETNNTNKQKTKPDQLVYMYTHGNLSSYFGNM